MKKTTTFLCAFLLVLLIPLLFNQAKANPLSANITSIIYPLCNGGCGNATVTASGGTSPYSYSWSPNGGSNASGTCLTAGSYTVTVTDAASNVATASVTITQPTQVIANPSATGPACNGGNGSVTANASGGTAPYTYIWQPVGKTGATVTGLSVGCYTILVQDDQGCQVTASVCITQPPVLAVNPTITKNIPCNGGTACLAGNASGGASPYTYLWLPNGQTSDSVCGFTAGTYTVHVQDDIGCTTSASITITQPIALNPIAVGNNNTQCVNANGSAAVTQTGGTSPYTYLWTPTNQTTNAATGLAAGTYTCTVTDNNGCTATVSVHVGGTAAPILTLSSTPSISNHCTGTATASVTGGDSPYTYLWWPGNQTTATINHLCQGYYCCKVTDSSGCSDSSCITIDTVTASGVMSLADNLINVNIYPNPNNGMFTLAYSMGLDDNIRITVLNELGRVIFTKQEHRASGMYTEPLNIGGVSTGIYMLRLETDNSSITKKLFVSVTR